MTCPGLPGATLPLVRRDGSLDFYYKQLKTIGESEIWHQVTTHLRWRMVLATTQPSLGESRCCRHRAGSVPSETAGARCDLCSHAVTLSGHKGFNPSFQQSPWMKATFEGFSCVSRASLVAYITPSLEMSWRSTQTHCLQWQAWQWHSVFAQWVLGAALHPHRLFFHSLSCQYPQHSHV